MSADEWASKANKLLALLNEMTKERWTLVPKDSKLELWRSTRIEVTAIHPQLMSFLIGGIMLGKNLRLGNYEAQNEEQKAKLAEAAYKAFGSKVGKELN